MVLGTIAFSVVGLLISFFGALPRTMDKVYWISMMSFVSIPVATIVTMLATEIFAHPSFTKAFLGVMNIVFAYIAHVAFFGHISEMKEVRDFPKSLAMLQIVDTCMYVVASIVIYCYAGPDVTSPALGSAGPLMKKVAYGLAIPTVIFPGIIVGHVACKYIHVRIFRGSSHLHNHGVLSVGAWVGVALGTWIVAWIFAESVPVFNELLSLISALFGSWFSYGFPASFWLYLNKGNWLSSPRMICTTIFNILILGIACTMCGLGLYVSGKSIHNNNSSVTAKDSVRPSNQRCS
ncbi:hypothetical protein BDQ94DRAFT_164042 [Aspergillus welwitschiae]|uniref:Amino acid transporter transmembrane domain-containing protein n=1 Tax=Aspergillus welwitschiae TaxID=1341132 RepID=A0A3F3PJ66_9EURO|nr:hypothetical protein BDQ94DRAFT_164042 [Aspergillus welwitschiae]RDH26969.1 hypothetical protein BDQ94DRAFT_164042 [Aspergillus welwitschiae]